MNRSDVRAYRFGDASRPGVLLGLSTRQAVPVVAGVLWLALCLQTPLGLPGGIAGLSLCWLGAFGRLRGAPLAETVVPATRLAVVRSADRRRWHRPPLLGTAGFGAEPAPRALAGLELIEAPVPAWLDGRRAGVAVVHDRRAGTLTAVLRVGGRGFPLAAGPDQDHMVAGWGRALSPLARDRSPVSRVAWQEATQPAEAEGHRRFLATTGALDRATTPTMADYLALVDQQTRAAMTHDVLVTLTVDQRRIRARRSRRDGGRLATAIDVLSDELRLLSGRLDAAGLTTDGPLSPQQLTTVVRSRSDPGRASHVATLARSLAAAAGRGAVEWGPMTVEPAWGHVRVDGAWHRTYRIAAWPQLPVPADWLGPLLGEPRVTRTVCVVMEPVPLSRSARAADREAMAREADADAKGRRGFRITARERKRLAEVEARERELAEGHAEFRFVGVVDVCAPDPDALDDAAAIVEQAAAQSLVDLRPLEARHDLGWVACLPLGRNVAGRGGALT